MLRAIGLLVLLLLLVGPLLAQAGLLEQAGLLRDFVNLEVRAFDTLVAAVRGVVQRHGG